MKNCDKCTYEGCCGLDKKIMQTNSYIEELFYRKCMEKNVRNKLLLEWIDSKTIYMSYTDFTKSDMGNYSRHDATHSIAILNAIESVLGKEKINELNATDLWMLLHCAYGHDFGMPYSYTELLEFWKELENPDSEFSKFYRDTITSEDPDLKKAATFIRKLQNILQSDKKESFSEKIDTTWAARVYRYVSYITAEFVRKNHARRSMEAMEKCGILKENGASKIDPRLYKIIGKCFYMHSVDDRKEIFELPPEESDVESGHCHPRFIAYMLRLGDLLDLSSERFDALSLLHYGKLPEMSELHKKKHESIEHVRYSDKTIEIVARSDDERVCNITNDWFVWIKEEVNFLISHWSKIASESIGGCTLSEPDTKVFLNDELFNRIEDCEFRVDKNTLIDLVIGRTLYKTKFEFMREYIQNALDASKMKFWIELENGNLDYFIEDEKFHNAKNRKYLLPFDIENMALKQYAIEVVCDYVKKYKEDSERPEEVIHIEIIDKGIGIDKECINVISSIGTGWKKRRRYAEYLERMPEWLKPTGGFGIGMQSGFMITDAIFIESRTEFEQKGRWIGLYSEENNGRIEERESRYKALGTKISLDVPYEWFSDIENYKEYAEPVANVKYTSDFMDAEKMSELVSRFIEKYLREIVGNPLFPIMLRQKGKKPVSILGFWNGMSKNSEEYEYNNTKYRITWEENFDGKNIEDKKLVIWDMTKNVVCRVLFKEKNFIDIPKLKWFFKGVRVWEERETIFDYIGEAQIDILGLNVKDCLTVDRNNFSNNFNCEEISNDLAIVLLNYLVDHELLLQRDRISGVMALRAILAYKFISEERKKKLGDTLKKIDKNKIMSIIVSEGMPLRVYGDSRLQQKEGFIDSQMGILSIYDLLADVLSEKDIYWTEEKLTGEEEYEIIYEGREKLWSFDEKEKFNNLLVPLREIFEKYYTINVKTLKSGKEIFYYSKEASGNRKPESKEKIFEIEGNLRQIFTFKSDYFEPLHVRKIPFFTDAEFDKLKKKDDSTEEYNIIISPIHAVFSDQDSLVSLKDAVEPEEEYVCRMTDKPMYDRLVDWVVKWQKNPKKYNEAEIREAYEELIRFIYKNSIEPKLK